MECKFLIFHLTRVHVCCHKKVKYVKMVKRLKQNKIYRLKSYKHKAVKYNDDKDQNTVC